MGRTCCVPGCTSNYRSNKEGNISTFSFPYDDARREKWIHAIRRADYVPGKCAYVCIKHFSENHIIRVDTAKRSDGTILTVPRTVPKLTDDAIPTIFAGHPSYMTQLTPAKRKSPEERREQILQKDELKLQVWWEQEKITNYEDLMAHQTKLKRLQSSAIPSRNLPLHKQLPQTIIIDEEIDESATEGNSKRQGNNFYHNVQKDSERYTYAIKSVLLKIREKKHILFGPKTKTINAEHKSQEWGKIFSFACNLGLVGKDGKFWDYMRDVFWPNIKGRTIARINKGYEKLEEIDDLVIDIIGKDLLVFAEQEQPTPSSSTSKSKSSVSSNSKRKKPEILEQNKKCKKSKTASSKKHQGEKQTEKTGKTEKGPEERRRELQVEYLKLLNEKLKIETYNLSLHSMYLERELGLSCSKLKKPCLEAERFHDKDKE